MWADIHTERFVPLEHGIDGINRNDNENDNENENENDNSFLFEDFQNENNGTIDKINSNAGANAEGTNPVINNTTNIHTNTRHSPNANSMPIQNHIQNVKMKKMELDRLNVNNHKNNIDRTKTQSNNLDKDLVVMHKTVHSEQLPVSTNSQK